MVLVDVLDRLDAIAVAFVLTGLAHEKVDVSLVEVKINLMYSLFVTPPSETVFEVIVTTGGTLSYVQLNSDAAVLLLPAISVYAPLATLIVVSILIEVPEPVGVKVAE